MQLFIFSFAVTLEVKNIDIAVLDRDNSVKSQEIIRNLSYSTTFSNIYRLESQEQLQEYIDTQKVILAIYIPQIFAQKIDKKEDVTIQIIGDGRKSNSAQIAQSYVQLAISKVVNNQSIANTIISRNLYNPNLDNFWWILPNLMGSLSMLVALLLTALSVARERELGTFEQLLVAPLSSTLLIIGKTIPPLLISAVEAIIIYLVAITYFEVPFVGSMLILFLGLISFLFSIVGLGLFISSISSTQQQGILGAFVLMVPYILMSGFATPVENMPQWLIPVTDIISLKYFLILLKGVFLKDISFDMAISLIVPMLALGFISLIFASWMFRKKIQ
jgi:ABC-2 type transport system permease protein